MYIPLDPKKTNESWEKLKKSLISNKFTYTICKGENLISDLGNDMQQCIKGIINRMKQADYVRLGSNRMILMPVHFAVNFISYNKAKLVELINLDDSENTLKNDLTLVIQFIFFENKSLKELVIPLIVNDIEAINIEIEKDEKHHQMIIRRVGK
ncbi:MAG: hypothetical protein H0U71_09805 [Gammaproteobacteria bacterium]|nr:hypothetical protein [Gammaproteobacteria bacterium]